MDSRDVSYSISSANLDSRIVNEFISSVATV